MRGGAILGDVFGQFMICVKITIYVVFGLFGINVKMLK